MPTPEKFMQTMESFGIDPDLRRDINEGYENLVSSSTKKRRAAYFARAMDLLNARAPKELFRDLMDENGCCKTGTRLKASKDFAARFAELPMAEKLERAKQLPHMGRAELSSRHTLIIHAVDMVEDGKYACPCPTLHHSHYTGPVSRSYCMCCAGHFRFHYQIILGKQLRLLQILSSPLDTDGAEPCAMEYEFIDG